MGRRGSRGTISDYTPAKLRQAISEQSIAAAGVGGSDTQVQYNNGGSLGGVPSLTFNDSSGDLTIIDDKKLQFGTNTDAYISYNEAGDDFMVISGSSNGIVLSGSSVNVEGNLSASGNVSASAFYGGDVYVSEYIKHTGDTDTHIRFTDDDINFKVGNVNFIDLTQNDGGQDEITFNEAGDDLDFRVESDNNTHMLFVDSGNDKIGINTDAPDYTLDVAGAIGINDYIYHNGDTDTYIGFPSANTINLIAGGHSFIKYDHSTSKILINNGNANRDTQIMADDGNVVLHVDAGNNRVGIGGVTVPSAELDVAGNISASVNVSASAFYGDAAYFGSNSDSFIKYTESTDDYLTISGSAKGMVLSGSTIELNSDSKLEFGNGTAKIYSPTDHHLYITASSQVSFMGGTVKIWDDVDLAFGTNAEAHIKYNESIDDYLTISGSAKGMVLSGTAVNIDGTLFLGTASFNGTDGKILLSDDTSALDITEGSNSYMKFSTTNSNERIIVGKEMRILDDTKLKFGNAGDASIEYNEDGDDYLIISGSHNGMVLSGSDVFLRSDDVEIGSDLGATFVSLKFKGAGTDGILNWYPAGDRFILSDDLRVLDDKSISFGTAGESSIKYTEATDDYLTISGSAKGVVLSGSNISTAGFLNMFVGGAVASDQKIYFGNQLQSYIEYNDNQDDFLTISGSAKGIVLSGSTIQIAGTLEGASPLKIGGELQFVSNGSDGAINLGPNQESKIYYENEVADLLVVSGSAGGITLSGSLVSITGKLGVGVSGAAITDGITLPNTSTQAGQIKASSFLSYSSRRYKKDIKKLEKPLDVINSLEGVSYEWKKSGAKDFGFIAEDVGQVLPGIVQWEDNGKDATGIDYSRIVSYLVEAVKEQQVQIEKLNQQLINRPEKDQEN